MYDEHPAALTTPALAHLLGSQLFHSKGELQMRQFKRSAANILHGGRLVLAFVALMQLSFFHPLLASASDDQTVTPIKHVIIIVGENRSFDHLFATYVPKSRSEKVLNLLSEGIINADGTPGPNFALAHQFQIVSAPNGGKFFSSAEMAKQQPYATLPATDGNGVGPVSPAAGILSLPGGNPGLPPADQFLFGTGGSGLNFTEGP